MISFRFVSFSMYKCVIVLKSQSSKYFRQITFQTILDMKPVENEIPRQPMKDTAFEIQPKLPGK